MNTKNRIFYFLVAFILWPFVANSQDNIKSQKEISVSKKNTPVNSVAFSPDGTKLVFSLNRGVVKLWNLSTHEFKTMLHPGATCDASFSPDGKFIGVACADNIAYLWNTEGKMCNRFTGHGALVKSFTEQLRDPWGINEVDFTKEGNLITCSHDRTCKVWKADSTKQLLTTYPVSEDNTGPLSCGQSGNNFIVGGHSGLAEFFNNENKVELSPKNISSVTFSSSGAYFSTASLVEVDPASYNFEDMSKPAQGSTGIVRIFTNTKKLFSEINIVRPTKIVFSPDEKMILIGNESGKISLWTVEGKKVKEFTGHIAEVTGLSFNKKSDRFVSSSLDGTLKIWDFTGKLIATLYSDVEDTDKFIIVSAKGYYYSSTREVDGFYYIINNKAYGFEQFDLLYNRPDLVLRELGYVSETILNAQKLLFEKRMEVMGINSTEELEIPQIKLNWSADFVTSSSNFVFSLECQTIKSPLKSIFISVNGVPLNGKTGLPVEGNLKIMKEFSIKLCTGKNNIAVSVMAENGMESIKEEKIIFYNKEKEKPKLYFIGLGSGKFSQNNEDYKLNSGKDINDVVEELKKNRASYFSDIVPLVFNDEMVVQDNFAHIRRELLSRSEVDDIVVLYFVGHGVLDKNNSYFLSSFNIDFNNPSSGGISYESLDRILDSIPSRNKLILLNACYSGEYNSQPALFAAMNNQFYDLRKNSGAYVITSSSSNKPSYFPANSNSLFTEALLTIIRTETSLNVSSLKDSINKNINHQKSTLRQYNMENNFTIW